MINNPDLSNHLSEELVRRLLVPVYLNSIIKRNDSNLAKDRKPCIQSFVALYSLTHVFSIITYESLLTELCELIFFIHDEKVLDQMCAKNQNPRSYSVYNDIVKKKLLKTNILFT